MQKFLIPFIVLGLSMTSCGKPDATEEAETWISLFDGETLEGWEIKFAGHELGDNYKETFRAGGGILSVNYDNYDTFDNKFGHIVHDQVFSDYIIRLDYRLVGEQAAGGPDWAYKNNGIMLHSQPAGTMALGQPFPRSLEVQLLGGGQAGERPTGNLCTPGTHVEMNGKLITEHCINSSSETYRGEDWVSVEIEVRSNEIIRHKINDVLVMEYSRPQIDTTDPLVPAQGMTDGAPVLQGHIALQAESHPTEFRNIRLLDLSE